MAACYTYSVYFKFRASNGKVLGGTVKNDKIYH